MIECVSCMNIYFNIYKMILNKIKRKILVLSDFIIILKCDLVVCGFKFIKSKLFCIKKNEKLVDVKIGSRNVVFLLLII